MPSLPPTYRIQDGCHNCRHMAVGSEFVPRPPCYCILGVGPEPVAPRYSDFATVTYERSDPRILLKDGPRWSAAQQDYRQRLAQWQSGREVDPAGICDQHERRAE